MTNPEFSPEQLEAGKRLHEVASYFRRKNSSTHEYALENGEKIIATRYPAEMPGEGRYGAVWISRNYTLEGKPSGTLRIAVEDDPSIGRCAIIHVEESGEHILFDNTSEPKAASVPRLSGFTRFLKGSSL